MSRAEFIARVRTAAAAGRAYRVAPDGDVTERTGYVGVEGDLCQRMADEVNAVGGTSYLVSGLDAARANLRALIDRFAARSALCWRHPLLERLGLNELLASAHVRLDDFDSQTALSPAERRERVLAAEIGITSADFAIAETGTLVMLAGPGHERVASLVPPVHVAIIERAQILPDLFDLFDRLNATRSGDAPPTLPSNLVLITGPSKTGDIELQLTTGVHGPGEWHVIVIDAP